MVVYYQVEEREKSPLAGRLELRIGISLKMKLEGLAEGDGVSIGEEVRRLVVREVARRKSRAKGVGCGNCPLVRTKSETHC